MDDEQIPGPSNAFVELPDLPPAPVTPVPSITDTLSHTEATKSKRVVIGHETKRRSSLADVNETRAVELSPKARVFYNKIKKWGAKMSRMLKNIKSYRERLAIAEKVTATPNFQLFTKYVNQPSYNFIMCQFCNQYRKPKARRYTLEEKILALSLFKGSGKGYHFLGKIFALSSTRTLNNLLRRVPFHPGINKHIFESLKKSVQEMKDEREKICILMFDEMAIDNNICYHRSADEVVGLEDYGTDRKPLLADHANVFLLKGVFRQWKQPVVFTFSSGPVKAFKLKELIPLIIRECLSIGLEVVATVCDQGSTNSSAIKMLQKETKEHFLRNGINNDLFGYLVDGHNIVPLFDVPHHFKGLRNNLMTKNLHFKQDGTDKIGKWVHLEQFYELDMAEPSLRICGKLTDGHIYKSKMNKMKVKTCTQVFSHTVGSLMKRIAHWDISDNFKLSKDAEDTADLILFLDELFDSLNISRKSKASEMCDD